mgnify:CR=1 FL=1
MLKKKLSFMLITDSRDKLRQFSISYRLILGCAILVAFLFIANIFLTTSFLKSQVSILEIKKLRAENQTLVEKFETVKGKISKIAASYDELVAKEIVIRNIFSLPEISLDERQLGIGGPENPNLSVYSDAMQNASAVENDVEALLRLSDYEQQKYEEVYSSLMDKRTILDHTPSIMPTRGYQSRGFGMKFDPFTGNRQFHSGIDIANRTGTPIYATADGTVTYAAFSPGGMGNMVTLNHGFGFETRYGHMSKVKAVRGQEVKRGAIIGYVGSTGYSTGPHLHYEVIKDGKAVNPIDYIITIN